MQDYQITFVEPWLFNQKLEFEQTLYHRELNYVSRVFDERRTGTRSGLRKTLGSDFVIGGVSYTLENIGIFNVDPNASEFFKSQEGDALISRLGTSSLLRHPRRRASCQAQWPADATTRRDCRWTTGS